MKLLILLALALLLSPGGALADEVFRSKNDDGSPVVYRKTDEPCTSARVLDFLHSKILDERRFKAGKLTWKGRLWESCWIEINGTIHSVDEEGSAFQPVPSRLFKDESI